MELFFFTKKIGYGLGSYALEMPDALRLLIGASEDPSHEEEVWLLEVDLDDMTWSTWGCYRRIRAKALSMFSTFLLHEKR